MSNNAKWKNKKINVKNYQATQQKQKRELSKSWKIALTGLFLIVIPSFLFFLFIGKDGWVINAFKDANRWSFNLPIALGILTVQLFVVSLLIWKFKVYGSEALNFLVPVALAMNSFLVTSGVDSADWYIRVLPAVGLAFIAVPILMINKAVAKKSAEKRKSKLLAEELKNKSLLD
ncbi:hypothetical protein AB5V95_02655 [Metamycoplasma spumans]|uniref:hypothetical protein n=1 Tax=Metamycoplasma spumans TaxID=92406 RepID=UPI0004864853